MKITINSKLLKGHLEELSPAYNPKAVIPIVLNAKVEAIEGGIWLTVTDLQTTIKRKVECSVNGKGVFLVPFKELKSISGILDAPLIIDYSDKGVVASFENDVFKLGISDDSKEFPIFPKVNREAEISVGKNFFDSIRTASKCVSRDTGLQYAVSHVCVELNVDSIVITGTDKNTLFTQKIPFETQVKDRGELLLPFASIAALGGLSEAKVYYNKKNILFVGKDTEVCILLGDIGYVPYTHIIPRHTTNLSLDVNDLISAINKSLSINAPDVFAITLIPEKDKLQLKTESIDTGLSCASVIPCNSTVPFEEIMLKRIQLLSAIKQLSETGGQDLEMSMQSPNHIVSMKMRGVESTTVLIMPMQK